MPALAPVERTLLLLGLEFSVVVAITVALEVVLAEPVEAEGSAIVSTPCGLKKTAWSCWQHARLSVPKRKLPLSLALCHGHVCDRPSGVS